MAGRENWNPALRVAVEVTDHDYVVVADGVDLARCKSRSTALMISRAIRIAERVDQRAAAHGKNPFKPRSMALCNCDPCIFSREEQEP